MNVDCLLFATAADLRGHPRIAASIAEYLVESALALAQGRAEDEPLMLRCSVQLDEEETGQAD